MLLLRMRSVFETLLHQLAVAALVITEVGFTVAKTVFAIPLQPFTEGVITYVTTTGSVVEFTKVSVIVAPVPEFVAGVIPGAAALDHVYAGVGVVLLLRML